MPIDESAKTSAPAEQPSRPDSGGEGARVDRVLQALLEADRTGFEAALMAPAGGGPHLDELDTLIVPALERLGKAWEAGDAALSQVYLAGRVCEEVLDAALARGAPPAAELPHVAIGVFMDHHTLGKRLVSAVLRSSGFAVSDLGHGLSVDDMTRGVAATGTPLLLVSTLMLPSALRVRELRDALDPEVRLVVGGAPFRVDPELFREVGADDMGRSSSDAVRLARQYGGMKTGEET